MPKPDIEDRSPTPTSQLPFLAGFVVFLLFLSEHTFRFGSVADETDTAAVIAGQRADYAGLFQFVYALLC